MFAKIRRFMINKASVVLFKDLFFSFQNSSKCLLFLNTLLYGAQSWPCCDDMCPVAVATPLSWRLMVQYAFSLGDISCLHAASIPAGLSFLPPILFGWSSA